MGKGNVISGKAYNKLRVKTPDSEGLTVSVW